MTAVVGSLGPAAFDDLGGALVEQFEPDATAEFTRAIGGT
jgi:hypothetical protein